ncbi:MAG: hypothetical protein RIT45_1217 [Pseudomonadota bacterium]|jgi:hypothetical protein
MTLRLAASIRTLLTLAATVALVGCASAEIGDSCDTSGSAGECVDGAICTQISDGNNVCRATCTADTDCGTNEQCNGVGGSNKKTCQPKK